MQSWNLHIPAPGQEFVIRNKANLRDMTNFKKTLLFCSYDHVKVHLYWFVMFFVICFCILCLVLEIVFLVQNFYIDWNASIWKDVSLIENLFI